MIRLFKELSKYRALLWALVVRHLSVRYRGSVLGFLWSFLNPLCLMLVYALVFRYYIRFTSVDNYTVFLLCGLLPWIWFSSGLLEGTNSIVASGHLITKSMFPAHLLVAVSVCTTLINFLLSLPVLAIFMVATGVPLTSAALLLPLIVLGQWCLLLGLCWTLASLNVHFRDVQHVIGNLLSFLFFLCPIVYPVSSVPERFRWTVDLNPVALLTRFYHEVLFEGVTPDWRHMLYFWAVTLLVMFAGQLVYNRYRESFAELL